MNRIDELKSLINNCKKTIELSEKEIEMLKSKEFAFERVKKDESYYLLGDFCGKIIAHPISDDGSELHKKRFENNNYFLTEERAEEVADKINFLLKLERLHDIYCSDYEPDWNDRIKAKWNVVFDYDEKEYVSYWNAVADSHTTVYFDSKKTADKVCEILNKELENEVQ